MDNNSEPRILLVDDDDQQAAEIRAILEAAAYNVVHQSDSLDALIAVEDERPAMVILDWDMPYIDGSVFTHAVRVGMSEPPPVIALIMAGGDPTPALQAGARTYLARPSDPVAVLRAVHEALSPP